jgi:hypothetical protein
MRLNNGEAGWERGWKRRGLRGACGAHRRGFCKQRADPQVRAWNRRGEGKEEGMACRLDGVVHQTNCIAKANRAGLNNAGEETTKAPARGVGVAAADGGAVDGAAQALSVDVEGGAGLAEVGEFDERRAGAESLAGAKETAVEAFDGKVFAESAGVQGIAEGAEFGDGFEGEEQYGLIGSAVDAGMGPGISGEADRSDGAFGDGALGKAAGGSVDAVDGADHGGLSLE